MPWEIKSEVIFTPPAEQTGAPFGWLRIRDWIYGVLHQVLQENIRLQAKLVELFNRVGELEAQNKKLFELAHLGCDTSGISSS
jgi:hypothetical protein